MEVDGSRCMQDSGGRCVPVCLPSSRSAMFWWTYRASDGTEAAHLGFGRDMQLASYACEPCSW